MSFGRPQTPLTPEQLQRQQRVGLGLSALSDVFARRDPIANTMQRQAMLQAQQKQAERDAVLNKLAQTNPEFAKMFELFGEKGLQQAYLADLQKQEQQIQTQQQVENLEAAGVSDRGINLYLSGLPLEDVMEIEKTGNFPKPKTSTELIEEVQQEKENDPEYLQKLQNMDQAFGFIDAAQQRVTEAIGPFLGPLRTKGAKETAEVVSVKNVLNERIREKFINQYSGRPSVYLNQRVDTLLPLGEFITEERAASKYQSTKKVLEEGLNEMKTKLDSGLFTGAERLEVEQNYKEIQSIVTDLDIVINSLQKSKPKETSLEPVTTSSAPGIYDPVYTE